MDRRGPDRQAWPLALDGCAGWLHEAGGDVGVVLCSPWGFEELCLRRSWRMLGDRLAAAGYPTLRFDYPGCADSLGDPAEAAGLIRFVQAATAAAAALRERGVSRIVLVGQGLGAVIAALAAPAAGAEGLALLAPPAKGRDHLRELSVWGAMVAETMHLAPDAAAPGAVAGFDMPERLRSAVLAANLAELEQAPTSEALVAARPGRAGDLRVAERLRSLGAQVTQVDYPGYEAVLGNPTSARPPLALFEALAGWLQARFPCGARSPAAAPPPAILHGPDFTETAIRVGEAGLHGILCEPRAPRRGATVLMLNAGGDPHTGWARSSVDQARALAADGVASLRLDLADVGDSPGPISGEPSPVHDPALVAQVVGAVGWLQARGLGPVLPVGRCSGAWTAFNAAVANAPVPALLLVNQRRWIWDVGGDVEAAVDQVGHFKRQARDPLKLARRLVRGEVSLGAALRPLTAAALSVWRARLGGHGRRLKRRNHEALRALAKRGVALDLVYSRGGEAHGDLAAAFGPDGRELGRHGNVRLHWVEGADHAFTPQAARAALLEIVRERALALGSAAERPQPEAARRDDLALRRAAAA